MTVVEFFDESQTENIIALLCSKYERVVYIGDSEIMTNNAIARIKSFVKERYPEVKLEFIYTKCDSISEITVKLTEIVTKYNNCCFEATGGTDAGLIALGIISERYGVPVVSTDVKTEYDVLEKLSVYEAIELNGGILEDYEENSLNVNAKLRRDVSYMWNMGKEDCEYWLKGGRFLSLLQSDTVGLGVHSSRKINRSQQDFLYDLRDAGFIENLDLRREKIKFNYRDELIHKIIIKSGNLLELVTFFSVLSRIHQSDAHRGVHLLWSTTKSERGNRRGSCEPVRNEIDVLFMKGLCPVFVSCKAGNVEKEALYELEAVANRFGGKYAGKILVAGCLSQNNRNPVQLLERAHNMGIAVIDDAYKMTPDRIGQLIANITF